MLGPLCNQTVNLKTDSKTLCYSILKLKYSPSILKHSKGLKKCALLNNAHNNCHRNYANGRDISANTRVQIDRSIDLCVLRDACHELFCIVGDFYASGPQVAEVTKSLLTVKPLCIKYRGN